MTALAPTDSALSAVSAARVAANRAECFAAALRRLADDLEAAAQRPSDVRAAGILAADRAEAVGAGERLAVSQNADVAVVYRMLVGEIFAVMGARVGADPAPASLREWATRWDAFALRVDP